jgi:NDP-sugar pyrophosphorylase family protein
MIRQAFVLGAGLGKRLRPLTEDLPKPLIPIFNKPLITFALDHLIASGIESFVVNTHHLADRLSEWARNGTYRGRLLRLVHEPVLLETGGGIKNAEPFLTDENFLVYSGDILTDLPLAELIEEHLRARNDVTLALRSTGISTQVAFRSGRVIDIGNRRGHPGKYDYANISVWNRTAFSRFSSGQITSFIPVLVDWTGAGGKIGGVVIEEGEWFNVTSPDEYLNVHRTIASKNWRPSYLEDESWPVRLAPDARIETGAQTTGFSAIGPGCHVEVGATVEDSILWRGSRIASYSHVKRCIVRTDKIAEGKLSDTII